MKIEISRTPTEEQGVCIVQRTNGNALETVREVTHSTGETRIDETTTIETITITRTVGEKIGF